MQNIKSKNPYEIRSDLLVLAFNILKAKKALDGESPTTEEVIEEAAKLNAFVSQ